MEQRTWVGWTSFVLSSTTNINGVRGDGQHRNGAEIWAQLKNISCLCKERLLEAQLTNKTDFGEDTGESRNQSALPRGC